MRAAETRIPSPCDPIWQPPSASNSPTCKAGAVQPAKPIDHGHPYLLPPHVLDVLDLVLLQAPSPTAITWRAPTPFLPLPPRPQFAVALSVELRKGRFCSESQPRTCATDCTSRVQHHSNQRSGDALQLYRRYPRYIHYLRPLPSWQRLLMRLHFFMR